MFSHTDIYDQLERNGQIFFALLHDADPALYTWRPDPVKWSLLEILSHLVDEEKEDFRLRIQHIFSAPETAFPSIDPEGWVKSRQYSSNVYEDKLMELVNERKVSIKYLKNLGDVDWSLGYDHPHFGRMNADMLLSNWLAHDYLHIRQITRYHFEFLKANSAVKLDYAGRW